MQHLEWASLMDKLRFAWSSSRSLFPNGLHANSLKSTAMAPRQHSRHAFLSKAQMRNSFHLLRGFTAVSWEGLKANCVSVPCGALLRTRALCIDTFLKRYPATAEF